MPRIDAWLSTDRTYQTGPIPPTGQVRSTATSVSTGVDVRSWPVAVAAGRSDAAAGPADAGVPPGARVPAPGP
jgi:hypothetical protein